MTKVPPVVVELRVIHCQTDPLPIVREDESGELGRGAQEAAGPECGPVSGAAELRPSSEPAGESLAIVIPPWRMALARRVQRAAAGVIHLALLAIKTSACFAAAGARPRKPSERRNR